MIRGNPIITYYFFTRDINTFFVCRSFCVSYFILCLLLETNFYIVFPQNKPTYFNQNWIFKTFVQCKSTCTICAKKNHGKNGCSLKISYPSVNIFLNLKVVHLGAMWLTTQFQPLFLWVKKGDEKEKKGRKER